MKDKEKNKQALRRRVRVRAKVSGTAERPRLSVFRSNRSMYVQLIDDRAGVSLVGLELRRVLKGSALNVETADRLGSLLAEQAQAKKIDRVVFDRGGRVYHGRIKALAEGARRGGLKF